MIVIARAIILIGIVAEWRSTEAQIIYVGNNINRLARFDFIHQLQVLTLYSPAYTFGDACLLPQHGCCSLYSSQH